MVFLKFTFLLLVQSCFPSCCFSGCWSLSVTWGLASNILSDHSYLRRRHTHTHTHRKPCLEVVCMCGVSGLWASDQSDLTVCFLGKFFVRAYCLEIPGLPRKGVLTSSLEGIVFTAIIQRDSVRERGWVSHRMMGVSVFSMGTFI